MAKFIRYSKSAIETIYCTEVNSSLWKLKSAITRWYLSPIIEKPQELFSSVVTKKSSTVEKKKGRFWGLGRYWSEGVFTQTFCWRKTWRVLYQPWQRLQWRQSLPDFVSLCQPALLYPKQISTIVFFFFLLLLHGISRNLRRRIHMLASFMRWCQYSVIFLRNVFSSGTLQQPTQSRGTRRESISCTQGTSPCCHQTHL